MNTEVTTNQADETLTILKALNNRVWQITAAVSLAVLLAIYWPTFSWWWRIWMGEESYYSHGILIPFMSAFVIYINRQTIAKIELKPTYWGLLILLPAIMVQLIAHLGNTASTIGLTLPVVLMGTIILLFGKEMMKALFFPTAFLFFMCVLPGFILTKLSFKIQMLSTTLATYLLNLFQFNAQQTGTQITLPNIEVMVGTPCSGFRMLISLLAFAVFFAYMKQGPMWGRLTLVGFTVPLSLISNSVRVALIALWGEFFGEQPMHTFHDYSGFIVLAVAFIILWWIAKVVKCEQFRNMFSS